MEQVSRQMSVASTARSGRVDLSLLVNAHREGGVLVPAIRSALAAKADCAANGIQAELIIVGDKVDEPTRRVIENYRPEADVVEIVEYGNLGEARTHGISCARGQFLCFLDGDDIWQVTWPAKAFNFALANDYKNTIFHTEIFAGFGRETFLRHQIETSSIIFHPLNLLTVWHYCNNLLAHKSVFERFRLEPYDHAKGYGSEDWHWSTVTLANGIERRMVPETVYFYRQDSDKEHLGSEGGLTLRPSKLFQSTDIAGTYADYVGWGEIPDEFMMKEAMALQISADAPAWLYTETKSAASRFEHGLFDLFSRLPYTKATTPQLQPALTYAYSRILQWLEQRQFAIISADCDALSAHERRTVHLNIVAASAKTPLVVLCGHMLTGGKLMKFTGNAVYVNYKVIHKYDHHVWIFFFVSALMSQLNAKSLVNYNSDLVDLFVREYGNFLKHKPVRTARVFAQPILDVVEGRRDRQSLGKILNSRSIYNEFWAPRRDSSDYLETLSGQRGVRVAVGQGEKPETILRDAICGEKSSHVATISATAHIPSIDGKGADVSCVLNLHNEGGLAVPTLRSIGDVVRHSRRHSVACELLIVLDMADGETEEVVQRALSGGLLPTDTRIVEVANGNLGRSRMAGVGAARGRYVAFLDGDDLYSRNWITAATFMMKGQRSDRSALHPEVNVYFNSHQQTFWHSDEVSFEVPYGALFFDNPWTSLSFAARGVFEELPVRSLAIDDGFGYEDWHWNLEAIAAGIKHRAVPKTCHFIRVRADSLSKRSFRKRVVVRPTSFSAKFVWNKLCTTPELAP